MSAIYREQPNVHPAEQGPETSPSFTLYLLRHGQSEEDKTKPNRGLTDLGKSQVRKTMTEILDALRTEPQKLEDIEFHLRDSATERTLQQVWEEYDFLLENGVAENHIVLPAHALAYRQRDASRGGPGVARRLKGVQGMDTNPDFRKKIKTPEFQKKVGAASDVEAWALAPDDDIPSGVETRAQMEERYKSDLAAAERVINYKIGITHGRRVVVIANAHASIATIAAASEFGIPLDKLMKNIGEVGETEGLRYDFSGAGTAHTTTPVGSKLTAAIKELTGQATG